MRKFIFTLFAAVFILTSCSKPTEEAVEITSEAEKIQKVLHDNGVHDLTESQIQIALNKKPKKAKNKVKEWYSKLSEEQKQDVKRKLSHPENFTKDQLKATFEDYPFPAQSNYHLYKLEWAGQEVTHYNTQSLLSLFSNWQNTEPNGWDLNSDGTTDTEDLTQLLESYGTPPITGMNLDSVIVIFPGFSSGIQSEYDGIVTAFDAEFVDPGCYLFRTTSDEVLQENYQELGILPYDDATLNTFRFHISTGFPEPKFYFRRF